MARPRLLSTLPNRLKQFVYYRRYHTRHSAWPDLFKRAPLALCPNMAMYDLVPGDVISGCIAFTGFYEWSLTKRIAEHAVKGGSFVDVGANMGYFSLLWTGLSRAGTAIAFEAAPRNIALCQNNIEQNDVASRVTLIPKAAADRTGSVTFDIGPADQTGWGGLSSGSANSIIVPTVRLDEQLAGKKIDVLKIDVEGSDTLVLFGCERLLKNRQIELIYFEQNGPRMKVLGIAPGEAQKFLRGHHYHCQPLGAGKEEWVAYPLPGP